MQIVSNEDITAWASKGGDHIFLHLDVRNWTASAYKEMKQAFKNVREHYSKKGHELVFATTDDEKIVKMWGRLHPLEELEKFGENEEYWIGAWLTGDN